MTPPATTPAATPAAASTAPAIPAFSELQLSAPIMTALKRIGYEQPSPIQAESIPPLLAGNDLLGTAQTGTGKTAAFALPLLSRLDLKKALPQVLVLAPTRELAIQVAEAFQTYASAMKGFHVLPIYGGQSMDTQLRQLRRGVHVVVGTPGRVMDHLRRGTLKLDQLQTVVLDEADEMLRMGFIDDVTWILEHTPESRQVALFSATMPKPIRRVADQYLKSPTIVKIEGQTATVESVEQFYWTVSGTNKLDALTRILEAETFDGIILFARTKLMTVELADKLEARGYAAAAINGDMTQKLRERTIENLKKSKIDILVATDVAARGIDVPRISHVINYDIPYDTEAYVHRIGRTGRAGRTGKAILFVAPRERRLLRAIEKMTRQPIQPMELPSAEAVNKMRINQFKETITDALHSHSLGFFHGLVQEYLDEHDVEPQQLATALAYLAQKDKPILLKEVSKKDRRERNNERVTKSNREHTGSAKNERRPDSKRERKPEHKSEHKSEHRPEHKPERKADRKPEGKNRPQKSMTDVLADDIEMETYRLAVGHNHDVKPGDIVGAIANEAEIDAAYIGRIELHDDYSTVDLPTGMPKELFQHLRKVRVRNQPLHIQRLDNNDPKADKGSSNADRKTLSKKPSTKKSSAKKSAAKKTATKKKSSKKADGGKSGAIKDAGAKTIRKRTLK